MSVLEHGEVYSGREWTGLLGGLQNLLASIGFQKSMDQNSNDIGDALDASIALYRSAIDRREKSGDGTSVKNTTINLAQALVLRAQRGLSHDFGEDRDEAAELLSDLIETYDELSLDETWARAKIGLSKAIDVREEEEGNAIKQLISMPVDVGENRLAARRHAEEAIEYFDPDNHIGRALAHLHLAQLYIRPISPIHYRKRDQIKRGIGLLKSAAQLVAVEDYPRFHSVVRQNRKVANDLLKPDDMLID